jgi:UDP-2-acetamido-2-deoxy-ribo-hexuluronate aminotransferase
MDLLLAADCLPALCLGTGPQSDSISAALGRCREGGDRVWLYAGSVQVYADALGSALIKAQGPVQGDPAAKALSLLSALAGDCQWLAALPGDLIGLAEGDPTLGPQLRALARFEPGRARLLTLDPDLVAAHPELAIDPEGLLAAPPSRPAIDFIDLKAQQDAVRPALETAIHRVLHHGRYILGPEVTELEHRLQAYTGSAHCITVASGTEALLIALMALGIGPGDEVITTPFTFVATAEVIVLVGAKPVFVDIEPDTCNIDASKIEAAIGPRTKAIMPVSLYGQVADMDEINAIAARHRLPVIEDAAQSFGAIYKGQRSCNLSTVGATSFFPSKPLGCYGDGGAIFTADADLAEAMREIRVHGQERRYVHTRIGVGGRMDTIQCAVILAKLARFDWELERRIAAGERYSALFAKATGLATPVVRPDRSCVYAQYTLQLDGRDALTKALHAAGVPTAVHYPIPLNAQPAYRGLCSGEPTPVADAVAGRVFSLPMHPDLGASQAALIADAVLRALA